MAQTGGLSKATRGGGGEPATPGTMAGATPQTAGSRMCALDVMGTTRGRCTAVGSLPERVAADKQDMAATEAGRPGLGVDHFAVCWL